MEHLCWRHSLILFLTAFGSLLDITGRSYRRASRSVFDRIYSCPRCIAKNERVR